MKRIYLLVLIILCLGMLFTSQATFAAQTWVSCTPKSVATYSSRIHIRCAQSFSGIVFFAYRSSDSAGAARYMSMATSALISGRNVRVLYDPADRSGAQIGCQVGDCRLLRGLEVF